MSQVAERLLTEEEYLKLESGSFDLAYLETTMTLDEAMQA